MSSLTVAPGSVVVVWDEEWLVTSVDVTTDGQLLQVLDLSELVRGTSAVSTRHSIPSSPWIRRSNAGAR